MAGEPSSSRCAVLALSILLTVAAPALGQSESPPAPTRGAPTGANLAPIEQELQSGDVARVRSALARMQADPSPAHVEALTRFLERGASAAVLQPALELAAHFAKESSSATVAMYLSHRNDDVRLLAASALGKTKGPAAVSALRLALRSSHAALREQAARALGEIGEPAALADLFLALDRGVRGGAEAIGKVCSDQSCLELADRTGKVPFGAMSEALTSVVARTDGRVKSGTKIEVVARIANLRTPQAAALLRSMKAGWPAKGDAAVLHAIDAALETFGGK